MYLLYSIALGLALAVTMPYWLVRVVLHGKYRAGLAQRLGFPGAGLRATTPAERCVWVHAVSLGEVLAVSALVERLKTKFPGWRVVVSTTTLTGQETARKRFGEENVFYFPLDFAFSLRPFIARLRPSLVIVAETEFWPNFLRLITKAGARIAVVNARISDRSFPRYRGIRGMLSEVLENVDLFLTQSDPDRQRLVEIGAQPSRIQVAGNLKFDVDAPRQLPIVAQLQTAILSAAKVWVCGSTVEGEEELLLSAFQRFAQQEPLAVMILAPRHPERFPAVLSLIETRGMKIWRRSTWDGSPLSGGVFLLDSIGELAAVYGVADFAFIGGSLVPKGGHNILEPAQFGVPIMVGPSTENFRDIVTLFEHGHALERVQPESLADILVQWAKDPLLAKAQGERGRSIFRAHAGATERTLTALEVLLWMPESMKPGYQQVGK